jgi:hypothetical protein
MHNATLDSWKDETDTEMHNAGTKNAITTALAVMWDGVGHHIACVVYSRYVGNDSERHPKKQTRTPAMTARGSLRFNHPSYPQYRQEG